MRARTLVVFALAGCLKHGPGPRELYPGHATHARPVTVSPPTRFLGPGGMVGGVVFVSPGSRGAWVTEPADWDAPLPGFIFGVDLRRYSSIAFVMDLGMPGCPHLPQLDAAVSGLPGGVRVALYGASGGFVQRIVPERDSGRAGALRWLDALPCQSGRSLARALQRAFEGAPDVVVVLSDFRIGDRAEEKRAQRDSPMDALSYADEVSFVEHVEGNVPPLIVVSFAHATGRGPMLAATSNGVYVSRIALPKGVVATPGSPRGVAGAPSTVLPSPTPDGRRVAIADEPRPACRFVAPIEGQAGVAQGRPLDLNLAAFESWLPREAAVADARTQAARRGADLLVLDARGTLEIDWPSMHHAGYGVAGRAFRCGAAPTFSATQVH